MAEASAAFDLAREETLRYHTALYRSSQQGTWIDRPSPFVMRSAKRVLDRPGVLRIADLGCGSGRHALPIASHLRPPSELVGIDLVPAAIEALKRCAPADCVDRTIKGLVADVEDIDLGADQFDFVICCSVLEHARDVPGLLGRIRRSIRPAGVVCLVIGADRTETTANGSTRQALIETALTSEGAADAIGRAFEGWAELERGGGAVSVWETRDRERYRLDCTSVRACLQRPA